MVNKYPRMNQSRDAQAAFFKTIILLENMKPLKLIKIINNIINGILNVLSIDVNYLVATGTT